MFGFFILISVILLIGWMAGKLLQKLMPSIIIDNDPIIATWLGIGIFGIFFTSVAIFMPLNPLLFLAFFVSLAVLARKEIFELVKKIVSQDAIGVMAILSVVTVLCNQSVFWYDSGLYHIQAIKWLTGFGYVWGEGLLHTRLGVISSWFTIPASINYWFLESRIYSVMGGVALSLSLIHFGYSLAKVISKTAILSDYFLFFAYIITIPIIMVWGVAISPSPDLPVIILTIIMGYLLIKHMESKQVTQKSFENIYTALILSVITTTIKLSGGIFVLLFGLYVIYDNKKEFLSKKFMAPIVFAAFLLLPNVGASIKTTGSLWYPLPISINTEWSLSANVAKHEIETIKNWAKWEGSTPKNAEGWEWLLPKNKAQALASAPYTQFFLLVSWILICLIASIKILRGTKPNYFPFFIIGILGVMFFYNSAPTLRFGLGIMVWGAAFGLAYNRYTKLQKTINNNTAATREWISFAAVALALTIVLKLFGDELPEKGTYRQLAKKAQETHWLLPTQTLSIEPMIEKTVNGYRIVPGPLKATVNEADFKYIIQDSAGMCWDAPLPCVQSELKNIVLKDKEKGIGGGFIKK